MLVLVIDDEPAIRMLCRVTLEGEGIQVLEAVDGITGLELARAAGPDLVLLDVMMPGIDGFQVAARLAAADDTAEIPILFISAHPVFQTRAADIGAEYLGKPFDPQELAAVVVSLAS
jgi:DNA-binding response OmpR family regulator